VRWGREELENRIKDIEREENRGSGMSTQSNLMMRSGLEIEHPE